MASSERPPRFPYGIIWPGFGNEQITLGNLVSFEEQFSNMNEACGQLEEAAALRPIAVVPTLRQWPPEADLRRSVDWAPPPPKVTADIIEWALGGRLRPMR